MRDIDRLTNNNTRYFTGRCIKCIDGDTIDVLSNGQVYRVRLYGIDTPERGQRFAKEATEFMEALVSSGDYISVETSKRGFHKRWIGEVSVHGVGKNKSIISINRSMVRAGFAWVQEDIINNRKDYFDNYIYAQKNLLNIHGEKFMVNPAEYRKNKSNKKKGFKK